MLICTKKSTSFLTSFLRYRKDFTNLLFWVIWASPPRLMVSICRITSRLYACEKSTSSLPYFQRYYKDITNLLFWVLWACLAMTSKNDTSSLQRTVMFKFPLKLIFLSHLFLEDYKVIASLLFWIFWARPGMPGHANQKQQP